MSFQDKLLDSFIAFEQEIDLQSPIHVYRKNALKRFENKGFPTKKDEQWKYTSLKSIIQRDYNLSVNRNPNIELKDIKKYSINDIDSFKIVFVDGVFNPFLSNTTHDGMDICVLSAALSKSKYKKTISKYFNKIVPDDESLASLNTSYTQEGAYIYIPKSVLPEDPVQILHFSTGKNKPLWLQPRNIIIVEENARVEIIERHQSLKSHTGLTNSLTEIYAEKNSFIDYYKIQNDLESSNLIDNTFIDQKRDSNVRVHTFSFGGKLTRNNLNFYHKGENIQSTLKGLTILEGDQHVDHNTLVNHAQPNCESHQDYKGIFSERSVGVFNGKILVDQIAQKTNAFQQNNNILIDNKAKVNSKPQLEIFADDVKCSHGCTIGQLNKEALFYLKSRGIPEKEAIALLTYGFANNVLKSVNIPSLKKRINSLISKKLGVSLGFDL
ncbi:MAG: FeS cluster assembly protein SufD [Flavobacteriales bacterium]|nr:MAG: FeS cluster assembly protein SufD [Flavobacteriales bacterium]|tara:strand:- start:2088 stop:3404 length:1317 start_codon:yes stop_codon:yes gene_type:complete